MEATYSSYRRRPVFIVSCIHSAARYYGSSSNGTSGCVSCPPHGNATANSNAGTTSVTGCYIGTGWTWDFSNDIGSGTERFSSACYFSI